MKFSQTSKSAAKDLIAIALMALPFLFLTEPAYCQQLQQATTMLSTASHWMSGIGATIVTIALMFVGFRMVFQAAEWKDVAPVFWGGVLIGGASVIAGALSLTGGAG